MLKGMLVLFGYYLRSKQGRWLLASLLIILLIALVCASRAKHHPALGPPILYQDSHLVIPEDSALRSAIHVEPVHLQTVVTTVVVPAVIQAIPANMVAVLPPLSGEITKIYKIIGERVAVGDPLFSVISPDLAQDFATEISAEAAYILAQKNLKRQRELAHFEINPLRDLEQAESDMQQAEAEFRRSRALLQALHINPTDRDTLGNLLIRSPINGVVTAISGGVGMYWSDLTSPVMTVADLGEVYAVASAQEHDLPDFFLGQEAQVVLEGINKSITGPVDFIDPIINPETRTINVGLTLANPDGILHPNLFARMKFKRKPRQRIVLPMTAVIQRGFDSVVFVESAPWQFEPRVVKVGLQFDDQIEIESGLAEQDRVALTGGIILND